jgi:hypothetical protein
MGHDNGGFFSRFLKPIVFIEILKLRYKVQDLQKDNLDGGESSNAWFESGEDLTSSTRYKLMKRFK